MLLGSTALVVDYGRGMVVRHQLQNYADAAAAAGAGYLDGGDDARARARNVIENTIQKQAALADGAPSLSIANYAFYSSLSPKIAATTDKDAKYISVTVSSEQVQYIFAPFIRMLSGEDGDKEITLSAQATASGNPTACAVPPLMVCDYSETLGSSYDLRAPHNVGKQIRLGKASGLNSLAPGNFGILDTPQGSQATQEIAKAMAAVEPEGCYKGDAIDTAPGARVDAVRDGINARFDMPAPPHHFGEPAPNVADYPRDGAMDQDVLGNGEWDAEHYWTQNHPGSTYPTDMPPHPSRYQLYLYELGETFAYSGKKTIYPVEGDTPDGYTMLVPSESPGVPQGEEGTTASKSSAAKGKGNSKHGDDDSGSTGQNGVPVNNTPVDDPRRRVVQVVMLNCSSDNVKGNGGPYNSNGKYFEMFLTEHVGKEHTIYGEIVRAITPANSSKLHANVSLNE